MHVDSVYIQEVWTSMLIMSMLVESGDPCLIVVQWSRQIWRMQIDFNSRQGHHLDGHSITDLHDCDMTLHLLSIAVKITC